MNKHIIQRCRNGIFTIQMLNQSEKPVMILIARKVAVKKVFFEAPAQILPEWHGKIIFFHSVSKKIFLVKIEWSLFKENILDSLYKAIIRDYDSTPQNFSLEDITGEGFEFIGSTIEEKLSSQKKSEQHTLFSFDYGLSTILLRKKGFIKKHVRRVAS